MMASSQDVKLQYYFSGEEIATTLPTSPFVDNDDLYQYLRDDFINQEALQIYGLQKCQSEFGIIMEQLCRPPLFTCVRINTLKVSPLQAEQLLVEYLNESASPAKFVVHQHPAVSDALLIRSSLSSRSVAPCEKVVVVDLACGIAVLRGSHIYAPGVMSMHPGVENGDKVSVVIDIQGKCLRGALKPFSGKKLFIGNGECQISRKKLFTTAETKGVAVVMTETVCTSPSFGNVLPELLFLQNLPSIVCCHVLNPQPGDTVLDMCAAPGGKTTHLAALMKNQGKVIAIDKTKPKVEKIKENARRWGASCVEAFVFDSTKICDPTLVSDESGATDGPGHPPFKPNMFDKILLDTPCSALGQRPQLSNKMTVNQLKSYKFLQRKLFARAVELLKTDGTLVYSTCSLTLEENEGLVFWALSTFSCLQLADQVPHIGRPGRIGVGLSEDQLSKLQRFGFSEWDNSDLLVPKTLQDSRDTEELCDTIGFFIAKFVKRTKC